MCRSGRVHRLGLERGSENWKARVDGQDIAVLSHLSRFIPLVLMEPNSHLLVTGPPEGRRRLLDWGVFHVEPETLEEWRRYTRIVKQRNAALRNPDETIIDSLDAQLARIGESLNSARQRHFRLFQRRFATAIMELGPGLEGIEAMYRPGWRGESLAEVLRATRKRDIDSGATGHGPHRADIELVRNGQAVKTLLSRGEQKSLAAALLLVQAQIMAEGGEKPLILLDDLASEFDAEHYARVLGLALEYGDQVWVTGIVPQVLPGDHAVFHVKHGEVREMV